MTYQRPHSKDESRLQLEQLFPSAQCLSILLSLSEAIHWHHFVNQLSLGRKTECQEVEETPVLRIDAIERRGMGEGVRKGERKRERREEKQRYIHDFSMSDSTAICRGIELLTSSKEICDFQNSTASWFFPPHSI